MLEEIEKLILKLVKKNIHMISYIILKREIKEGDIVHQLLRHTTQTFGAEKTHLYIIILFQVTVTLLIREEKRLSHR